VRTHRADDDEKTGAAAPLAGRSPDAGTPLLVSTIGHDLSTRELVEGFVRGLPARLTAIAAAIDSGDLQGARQLVHRLSGSAGSFGFPPIMEAGVRLEGALVLGEGHVAALAELGDLCHAARATGD
jgi:HPt (histidine-containing phosphotransfer) domain-containing protein